MGKLFLIYINDMATDLSSNAKLFADNTSDINLSAEEVNDYLAKINNCAFQWKMNFNPDSCKQAQGSISLKTVFKTP